MAKMMMRFAVILFALSLAPSLASGGASAASPEAAYFAARDKAIADIKALEDAKASESTIEAAEDKASADLVNRLKEIIGPVAVKGFAPPGELNIALSQHQEGYGNLDGLASYRDDQGFVVTSRLLFQAWLDARSKGEDSKGENKTKPPPTDLATAVRDESFYNDAYYSDVSFENYIDLPVTKPAGTDLAVAALGGVSQGFSDELPETIVVTVVKGNRVFIASISDKTLLVGKIAACEPIWAKAHGTLPDVDGKIAKDYRACFNARARRERFFAGVTKAAQRRVDLFAGN